MLSGTEMVRRKTGLKRTLYVNGQKGIDSLKQHKTMPFCWLRTDDMNTALVLSDDKKEAFACIAVKWYKSTLLHIYPAASVRTAIAYCISWRSHSCIQNVWMFLLQPWNNGSSLWCVCCRSLQCKFRCCQMLLMSQENILLSVVCLKNDCNLQIYAGGGICL